MGKLSLIKVEANEENINLFVLIQNSVYNPKTFKMGGVTKEKASGRFNETEVLFIKEGDNTIGTLEYQLGANDYAYFKSIAIMPEFQGKGIGRYSLVYLLHNQLKHISRIGLNTHPKNRALGMYKSLGFVVEKKIPGNKLLGYEPSLFLTLKRHF